MQSPQRPSQIAEQTLGPACIKNTCAPLKMGTAQCVRCRLAPATPQHGNTAPPARPATRQHGNTTSAPDRQHATRNYSQGTKGVKTFPSLDVPPICPHSAHSNTIVEETTSSGAVQSRLRSLRSLRLHGLGVRFDHGGVICGDLRDGRQRLRAAWPSAHSGKPLAQPRQPLRCHDRIR